MWNNYSVTISLIQYFIVHHMECLAENRYMLFKGWKIMVQTFFRSENKDQAVCSGFQHITLILCTLDGAEVFFLQDL